MTDRRASVYDSDEYYADSIRGLRLTPILEWLVRILDWRRARAVKAITGLSGGRILDVGAGDGKFLHFMQRLGFDVSGTTSSTRSATAAQALFGLRLDVSESLDAQLANGPFDLVTYWHVLEHLDEPSRHTDLWPRLVRPGGFIAIEVPDVRSVGARLCYRSWLGSDVKHHINQQAPATILAKLKELGFDPIRTERFSGKYSYAYLWSALLGFLFGRHYDFATILGLLKKPLHMVRTRPWWTINAVAAAGYLAPAVLALMLYESTTNEGEVLRIYARRRFA